MTTYCEFWQACIVKYSPVGECFRWQCPDLHSLILSGLGYWIFIRRSSVYRLCVAGDEIIFTSCRTLKALETYLTGLIPEYGGN